MNTLAPHRLSKHRKMPTPAQRLIRRNALIRQLLLKEITVGTALKAFRLEVLAIKQQQYAEFVKISRKTLSDLENDKGNYSLEIINQALRPLELEIGILPTNRDLILQVLDEEN